MTPTSTYLPAGDLIGNRIRLVTLIRVRWIAIGGQVAALLVAGAALGIDIDWGLCSMLIALPVLLNLTLILIAPANTRLSARQVRLLLCFDIAQIMGLIALTGGLDNPFAFLVLAPVTIAATVLPLRPTLEVAAVAAGVTTLAWLFHLPIRMLDGSVVASAPLLTTGFFVAILTGIGFLTLYARWVSLEIHVMSEALLATQMALARAQKLTDLGGVVAAAAHELGTPLATIKLASSEMMMDLKDRPELAEDARLIRDQADRCRDILRAMGQAGKRDSYISRAPLAEVLREAAEPHMTRGKTVDILLAEGLDPAEQPMILRRPELIHGLRNLIQNAVDFATASVRVEAGWDGAAVRLRIADDGPGYPPHLIQRLGDPFLPRRDRQTGTRPEYEGMGLGLFIAKTLLERTGAEIVFMNDPEGPEAGQGGALVTVDWPAQSGLVLTDAAPALPDVDVRITG
jgi:two-component system sensor histidine kinase RegB